MRATSRTARMPGVIAAIALVIGQVVLTKTRYGRFVYAIGGNRDAARISGVPVKTVKASVHVTSASAAAPAGITLGSRSHAGGPFAGQGLKLDGIPAGRSGTT